MFKYSEAGEMRGFRQFVTGPTIGLDEPGHHGVTLRELIDSMTVSRTDMERLLVSPTRSEAFSERSVRELMSAQDKKMERQPVNQYRSIYADSLTGAVGSSSNTLKIDRGYGYGVVNLQPGDKFETSTSYVYRWTGSQLVEERRKVGDVFATSAVTTLHNIDPKEGNVSDKQLRVYLVGVVDTDTQEVKLYPVIAPDVEKAKLQAAIAAGQSLAQYKEGEYVVLGQGVISTKAADLIEKAQASAPVAA